VSDRTWSI